MTDAELRAENLRLRGEVAELLAIADADSMLLTNATRALRRCQEALAWIVESYEARPKAEHAGRALEMAQHAAMALERDPPGWLGSKG